MSSDNPPERADAAVLNLRGVRVRRDGWSVTLDRLDLHRAQVGALVGPSGCGKSTLLLGCTGLLSGLEVEGERRFQGAAWPEADTSAWREVLAGPVTVLLQDAKAALDPLQRIGVQIMTASRQGVEKCRAALRSLGLTDPDRILTAFPHRLSGGQAQKVLLAIALLRAPRLLVADEPTASLDGASVDDFVAGLRLLQDRHGTAVLLATHDHSLVAAVGAVVHEHDGAGFVRSRAATPLWPSGDRLPPGGVVLRARGVSKSFGMLPVLSDLELQLSQGEVVAVVGPSGCGKTTLARILAGQLAADRGTVDAGSRPQLLFQDAYASLTPHRTIRSLVEESRVPSFRMDDEARMLGLDADTLGRDAAELSGGERRRAALLRALSVEPAVLILDEPTASLDHASAVSVAEMMLAAIARRRLACLLITHDREMAQACAHRVLELCEGRLA